jgi:transcription elongation factor S-II
MFKIPKDNEINFLTQQQKDELCSSITSYTNIYMSDNRLGTKLRENIQRDKYLDIKYNLETSEQLLINVLSGQIEIKDLPWYEPYKLNNTLWQTYIDKQDKNRKTKESMSSVDIFTCKKCQQKKCTTYELQTRSIDEPMTTFIKCLVCGHQWKT